MLGMSVDLLVCALAGALMVLRVDAMAGVLDSELVCVRWCGCGGVYVCGGRVGCWVVG